MRRTNPENVSTLVLQYLRNMGLETPLNEHRAMANWAKVAGEAIARSTKSVEIYNQTLVVKISSPVVRSEVMMMRRQLVERLNKSVGALVIYDIQVK